MWLRLTSLYLCHIHKNGRARRGASGALYSQPAIARLNSSSRVNIAKAHRGQAMLKIRSCATDTYKPRQVRKEATVVSTSVCCRDA